MEEKNSVISEEQEHLEVVQEVIRKQLDETDKQLDTNKENIINQKKYLWENIYELDAEEIASNRVNISEEHDSYEFYEKQKRLLLKLQDNTYFGRIDFVFNGGNNAESFYIGLGGLRDKSSFKSYVYDWRAPISSMYYDFDKGDAYYDSPMGRIEGKISQKRQLKVRGGKLEYAFISDYKVDDEILQRELSGAGNTKMKNIVATIQREQNAIVRDKESQIMVVQGVAGSGKTSIALHRIAFLLYQNRDTLLSSDILIISPNNIFADYISNVLPELGEENISEVTFDEIAEHELKGICKYEPKYKQMEYIIQCGDDKDKRLNEIRFKNSMCFLRELKTYAAGLEDTLVHISEYSLGEYKVSKEKLTQWYGETFKNKPVFERLEMIADRIADCYETEYNTIVSNKLRNKIKQDFINMASVTDIVEFYKAFLSEMNKKYDAISDYITDRRYLYYEDVFPAILLKFLLYGKNDDNFDYIKHVVIDEMQDYTMVQYEILNQIFNCKMTILGDVNQVVDQYHTNILDDIQAIFNQEVTFIKMMKSYRSTYEIGEFCRKLCGLNDAESFERHGKEPLIKACSSYDDMIAEIEKKIDHIDLSVITTAVIICKSASAAKKLYMSLDEEHKSKCYLMNNSGDQFTEGIIITNSYLVKGLEFDCVIVPEVTEEEYKTERDKQILYISCTRALHELNIYYFNGRSHFLDEALK